MSYKIIGLDCETTGLNGEVVEVGIATWSAEPQQYHTYCKPDQPIPLDAMVIHGITNNKVKDAPKWMDVKQVFQDVVDGADYLVGHNIEFDIRMTGLDTSKVKVIDTLKLAKKLLPELKCKKNMAIYYHYDGDIHYPLEGATHTAVYDVNVTLWNLYKILKQFNLTLDQAFGIISNNEVEESAEDVTICPFKKHIGKKWVDVLVEESDYIGWLLNNDKIRSEGMVKYLKELINKQ